MIPRRAGDKPRFFLTKIGSDFVGIGLIGCAHRAEYLLVAGFDPDPQYSGSSLGTASSWCNQRYGLQRLAGQGDQGCLPGNFILS